MSITPDQTFILKERIASLKSALLEKHPRMPILLQEIHKTLKQYPEQVTILEESDIQIIVNGLMQQTGVEFAQAISKGSGKKNQEAKIKSLGADAF